MMRSLFSAVSGLKTHQTRMDVIGNNIANVNTEAFKASSVRFSELMYQSLSTASGGDAAAGTGGVNAKQIGLGVNTASTMINITGAGSSETTGNPFDLKLSDSQTTNFFIVSDGTNTMFTRAGSFYVDGNGYLCMSSTGYTVQGWQVDKTTGEIRKDTVSPLQVMAPDNTTAAPEATTKAHVSGVLDKEDTNVTSDDGYVMTLGFYDDLGYNYTAKFAVKKVEESQQSGSGTSGGSGSGTTTDKTNKFSISLSDILDSKGNSIIPTTGTSDADIEKSKRENLNKIWGVAPTGTSGGNNQGGGSTTGQTTEANVYYMEFDPNKGTFIRISESATGSTGSSGGTGNGQTTEEKLTAMLNLKAVFQNGTVNANGNTGNSGSTGGNNTTNTDPTANVKSNFKNIEIDFSAAKNLSNGGKSSLKMENGTTKGQDTGKKLGAMIGLTVDQSGKIYGSYDNGNTELLGQIAVAQFANASGLEKIGNNCYQTTLNSGEFDGVGVAVDADGSKIESGQLEMSNVDLSGQFTDMIITQRGFQANSRVITVSDTLLEELINLKR